MAFEEIHQMHEVGENIQVPRPIKEVLSWEIAADISRRFPNRFAIIELHPANNYDCLTLWDLEQHSPFLYMNRRMASHITNPSNLNWTQVLNTPNRRHVVELIEREMSLASPSETPSTEQSSIGPMLIAQFLHRTSLNRKNWIAVNGLASGYYGDGIHDDLFAAYGIDRKFLTDSNPQQGRMSDGYEYWFLMPYAPSEEELQPWDESAKPPAMFDAVRGVLHRNGKKFNLLAEYQQVDRSIEALDIKLLGGIY
jgi:hypothetical protein